MSLSNEDSLRINVLIVNANAVRIDEGTMTVYGLLKNGQESKISLNPNCRSEQYIKDVRELLSSTVLGSPGGYPVFLKRWTRMGQASDSRLDDLLMLGEPEAVVAVCGAQALTPEVAERAWWAMPDADNARQMLKNPTVASSEFGQVLADFLVEFLPFEQDPKAIIESVSLILQPNLISDETRELIWSRGKQKNIFRLGFLKTMPDDLPEPVTDRADYQEVLPQLDELIKQGNRFAIQLSKLLSSQGQTYLNAVKWVLRKPTNQDAVVALLDSLVEYFEKIRILPIEHDSVESIENDIDSAMCEFDFECKESCKELHDLISQCPEFNNDLRAMLVLSHSGVPIVNPIFSHTDAVGSVMRKKIEPLSKPIMIHIDTLMRS
jgi:hypothetical protein